MTNHIQRDCQRHFDPYKWTPGITVGTLIQLWECSVTISLLFAWKWHVPRTVLKHTMLHSPHALAHLPLSGWQQAALPQQTLRKQKKIRLLVVAWAAINRKSEDSQEKDTHNSECSSPEAGKKTTVIVLCGPKVWGKKIAECPLADCWIYIET